MTKKENYEEKLFKLEDFSKKTLSFHSYTNCQFHNCNFADSIFQNAKFISCNFNCCNLSLIKVEGCRFQDILFTDTKIVGAEFFKCERTIFSLTFKKCLLVSCNFSDLNMKGFLFDECRINDCYFTNTNLSESLFRESDLSRSIFHKCDLSKADLSSAINYEINPLTNKIRKARFSLPEAVRLLNGFDIIIN